MPDTQLASRTAVGRIVKKTPMLALFANAGPLYGPYLALIDSTTNTGLWSILSVNWMSGNSRRTQNFNRYRDCCYNVSQVNFTTQYNISSSVSRWPTRCAFEPKFVGPLCGSVVITAVAPRGADHAKNDICSSSSSPGGMGRGRRFLLGVLRPPQPFSAS
jgi:hypothetical protein